MRNQNRLYSIAAVLVLVIVCVGMAGCPKGAMVAAKDVAQGNLSFERAVTKAHTDGFCDTATEQELLGVSKKIAQGGNLIVALLLKNDKQGALTQVDNTVGTIDDAMNVGLLGIKDTGTRAALQAILLGIRGGLITAKSFL
jgi:hypothetical protein